MEEEVRHWRLGALGSNADGKTHVNNALRQGSKDLPRITKKERIRPKTVKKGNKEELSNICLLGKSLDATPRDTGIKNNKFEIDTPRNHPRASGRDDVSTVATGSQNHTLEQKIWIDMSNVAKFGDDGSILTTDVIPKDLLEAIRRRESLTSTVTSLATVWPSFEMKNQRINILEEKGENCEIEKLRNISVVESTKPSSNTKEKSAPRRNFNKEEAGVGLENPKSDEDTTANGRTSNEITVTPAFTSNEKGQLKEVKVVCHQRNEKDKASAISKKNMNKAQGKASVEKKKIQRQIVEPSTSALPPPHPPTLESFTVYYVPSNDLATLSPTKRQWMLSPRQLIFGSPPKKSRSHQNAVVSVSSPMKRMSSFLLKKVTLRDESLSLASPHSNKPKHIIDTGRSDARFYPDFSCNTEDDGLLLLSANENP